MEREKRKEQNVSKIKLLLVTGSESDKKHLRELKKLLNESGTQFNEEVISCHRNLSKLPSFIDQAIKKDYSVIIAVANSVSNLPAILAGALKETGILVIGVGLDDKGLNGVDSLLSVNTIPKGVPVVNTGIGKVGLYNAGLAAMEIIKNYDKRRSI
jgi:5-(carboxyamino)imidazole ribonucleotide mutase